MKAKKEKMNPFHTLTISGPASSARQGDIFFIPRLLRSVVGAHQYVTIKRQWPSHSINKGKQFIIQSMYLNKVLNTSC